MGCIKTCLGNPPAAKSWYEFHPMITAFGGLLLTSVVIWVSRQAYLSPRDNGNPQGADNDIQGSPTGKEGSGTDNDNPSPVSQNRACREQEASRKLTKKLAAAEARGTVSSKCENDTSQIGASQSSSGPKSKDQQEKDQKYPSKSCGAERASKSCGAERASKSCGAEKASKSCGLERVKEIEVELHPDLLKEAKSDINDKRAGKLSSPWNLVGRVICGNVGGMTHKLEEDRDYVKKHLSLMWNWYMYHNDIAKKFPQEKEVSEEVEKTIEKHFEDIKKA